MEIAKKRAKKTIVAIGGGLLLIIGILAIPYPGPGWLIVFAALGILSTEFEWAKRVLRVARGKYDAWSHWLKGQPIVIRAAVLLLTAVVVVATLWLLGVFGMIDKLFHLGWQWLHSPIKALS